MKPPSHREKPKTHRVLVVDDHPLVRERLREVIEREPDLTVCGEAADRAGALELLEKSRPDLVLVDLSLRESSGLELIKDIHVRSPHPKLLVLSMHAESLYAERAVRAGAHGYITKQEASRKVIQAIRDVLAGELYVSPAISRLVLARVMGEPNLKDDMGLDKLSDRELEVFRLIGQGYSTRQVAEAMKLDVKTIETYRARIREKLGFADAAAMRQAAIHWGYSQRRC